MQKTLRIETPFPLSQASLCFYSISQMNALLHISTISTPISPTLGLSLSHCHGKQTQKPIICARKRKSQILSARTRKLMFQLIPIIASNLKISPQPLDWLIAEIAGGDGSGGGWGFWKGFGWGGFDGWRRKRKGNLLLCGFLMIFCLGFLCGKEIESNVVWWVLGFSPIGVALIHLLEKRGIQSWIFGFCLCIVSVSLCFRREAAQKWVGKFGIFSSMIETERRRRRRRRRRSG